MYYMQSVNLLAFESAAFRSQLSQVDFPKGDHRRPPAFVIRRFGERVFGFLRFRAS